jgi:hypothetical protein
MFSFFKSDPVKKLNKQQDIILEQAMHAQRNGDMKSFAQLTFEAEQIQKEILIIQEKNNVAK